MSRSQSYGILRWLWKSCRILGRWFVRLIWKVVLTARCRQSSEGKEGHEIVVGYSIIKLAAQKLLKLQVGNILRKTREVFLVQNWISKIYIRGYSRLWSSHHSNLTLYANHCPLFWLWSLVLFFYAPTDASAGGGELTDHVSLCRLVPVL